MNSIIEYVLNIGSHKQQFLALNDALAHTKLINQAADCVYFCREREREREWEGMKKHASILKVVMKYKNQKGRKLDHKLLFVNTYLFLYIKV